MKTLKIVIKYHNSKMLLTIDIYKLIETIFNLYGENICIDFIPMTDDEKMKSSNDNGMFNVVNERFWFFEVNSNNEHVRRSDIEIKIVKKGRK